MSWLLLWHKRLRKKSLGCRLTKNLPTLATHHTNCFLILSVALCHCARPSSPPATITAAWNSMPSNTWGLRVPKLTTKTPRFCCISWTSEGTFDHGSTFLQIPSRSHVLPRGISDKKSHLPETTSNINEFESSKPHGRNCVCVQVPGP